MNLNHIELPPTVLAGLYRDLLISEDTPAQGISPGDQANATAPPEVPVIADKKWPSLGENRQHVLVVVEHEDVVHLPDGDLTFLTKILGACKLTLADVAIVNLHNYDPATFNGITPHFKSSIVLLFGTEPGRIDLPISFPHFQVQVFKNITYLFTPTLQELQKDDVKKSKCWVCLKRIFNVKSI